MRALIGDVALALTLALVGLVASAGTRPAAADAVEKGAFGAGIVIGEPIGLCAKLYLKDDQAKVRVTPRRKDARWEVVRALAGAPASCCASLSDFGSSICQLHATMPNCSSASVRHAVACCAALANRLASRSIGMRAPTNIRASNKRA